MFVRHGVPCRQLRPEQAGPGLRRPKGFGPQAGPKKAAAQAPRGVAFPIARECETPLKASLNVPIARHVTERSQAPCASRRSAPSCRWDGIDRFAFASPSRECVITPRARSGAPPRRRAAPGPFRSSARGPCRGSPRDRQARSRARGSAPPGASSFRPA